MPGRTLLTAAVVIASTSCQPPQPSRSVAVSLKAESFAGSNGVRVFTVPDRNAEFVAFHVRYRTGGIDDPQGKEGLAHLVEHLMFTRTINLGGRVMTIGSRIDDIALTHNATTRPDITHYWTVVRREHVGEMFAIETVRMTGGCAGLSEAELTREKEVVRNELRQRYAGDFGKIYPAILEAFYGDHPYARPVGGSDQSVQAITVADVCAFLHANYAPSKATFYLVGDIEPDEVRTEAVKWLGRIRARDVPPPIEIPRVTMPTGKKTVTLDVEAPYLVAGWRVPVENTAYPLIDVAMSSLDSRMGFFAFTYEIGSDVSADTFGGARAPIAVMSMKLASSSKVGSATDAVKKAGNSVEFGMPQDDFDPARYDMFDARSGTTEQLLARFESPTGRGLAFADLDDRSGGRHFLVEEVAAIDKTSAGALRSMASGMFDFDKAALLHIKPSGKIRAGAGSGAAVNHSSNQWRVPVDPTLARSAQPLPYLPDLDRVAEDYRLGSGMRVVLATSGDLPLVRASLSFSVGHASEPENMTGLASIAGNYQGGSVSDDTTTYRSRALNTRIDYMVNSLSAGKRAAIFDQDSLVKSRKPLLRTLSQPSTQANLVYVRKVSAALYGADHPYASRGLPNADAVKRIDRSDLQRFGRKYYGGASGALVVAGQYDVKLMKKYIKKHFNHWEKRSRPAPPPAVDPSASIQAVVAVVKPGANQLSVELTFPGPRGIDDRFPARLVLAALVNGRLRSLREERGLTYGVSAEYKPALGPGRWAFEAEVDPSRATEAVGAIINTLRALRTEPAAGQLAIDFVLARRSVVNELLLLRTLSSQTVDQLEFAIRFGLPLDYQSNLAAIVAEVTPEQVRELLGSELAEKRQVVGLLGSTRAVEDGQRGALAPPPPPAPPPAQPPEQTEPDPGAE